MLEITAKAYFCVTTRGMAGPQAATPVGGFRVVQSTTSVRGYSALSYLQQVPLDVVKLDRIFTSTMTSSARQRDLVEGIVRLSRAMDLEVVAEGVETE